MIVWMNRVARSLRKDIERRVESYAQQSTRAAGWGVGAFVFFMVVREGAELVLILRAVELSSAGVQVWIGTMLGIAIAVGVGFFFFQGTLRIPLHRFFTATSVILMVVAFQLALTGVHELSEATWIWSSKTEMAHDRPDRAQRGFLFRGDSRRGGAGGAARMVWRAAAARKIPVNPAERRMREWEFRRQRRWSFAAAILCVAGDRFARRRVRLQPRDGRADSGKDCWRRKTIKSAFRFPSSPMRACISTPRT